MGKSWAPSVGSFTIAGGVVAALDGAAGRRRRCPRFNTSAGLFAIAHTVISRGTPMSLVAPGDVVRNGFFAPYAAEPNTVYFQTSLPDGRAVIYVIVDPI